MEDIKIVLWSSDKTRQLLSFSAGVKAQISQKQSLENKSLLNCAQTQKVANSNKKKSIARIKIDIGKDEADEICFSFCVDSCLEKSKSQTNSDSKKQFVWTDRNLFQMNLTCLPNAKSGRGSPAQIRAFGRKYDCAPPFEKKEMRHLLQKRKMILSDSSNTSGLLLKKQVDYGRRDLLKKESNPRTGRKANEQAPEDLSRKYKNGSDIGLMCVFTLSLRVAFRIYSQFPQI